MLALNVAIAQRYLQLIGLVVRFASQILKSKLNLSSESLGQTHNFKGVHIWSKGDWAFDTIQVKVSFISGCCHVCLHIHAFGNLWDELPFTSRVVAPTCGTRKSLILPREAFDLA